MNICVFCSASTVSEEYTAPVKEFARLLAEGGHTLVWGGSDTGMMKLVADTVMEHGGKVIGVSMEVLRERARKEATEMIIEKDLGARKATMLARSDAIVMLVGGTGTLDEASEVIALKTFDLHNKAVVVMNTDNFYAGLKVQYKKMEEEGFLHRPLAELVHFADTPQEVMEHILSYQAFPARNNY